MIITKANVKENLAELICLSITKAKAKQNPQIFICNIFCEDGTRNSLDLPASGGGTEGGAILLHFCGSPGPFVMQQQDEPFLPQSLHPRVCLPPQAPLDVNLPEAALPVKLQRKTT